MSSTLEKLEELAKRNKHVPPSQSKAIMEAGGGAGGRVQFTRSVADPLLSSSNTLKRYKGARARADELQRDERRTEERPKKREFPAYPGRRKTKLQAAREAGLVECAPKKGEDAGAAALAAAAAVGSASKQPNKPAVAPLKLDQSNYPLHLFDADIHEMHTPEGWIASGSAAKSPYYLGADGGWQWLPCEVLGYDSTSVKYEVRFKALSGAVDEQAKSKMVRRLNILFDLEDKAAFEQRLREAEQRREEAKAQVRLDHYVLKQLDADVLNFADRPGCGVLIMKI